jgi:ElaB/YqjD/DUF883 family membrane-anchored ribosome-binding protein
MKEIHDGEFAESGDITTSRSASRGNSTFDDVKQTVADKLHTAAQTIQEKASQNRESPIGEYASTAASWLDDASGYIREVDPQRVKSDIQTQVRRNPGRSLLIAGAAGLLLGVLLRR